MIKIVNYFSGCSYISYLVGLSSTFPENINIVTSTQKRLVLKLIW